ncbi:hypothetical protein KIN20_014372 [Parelaphostrongylus tenuis]|uniref:Uncharacterized protein n=1 Tax=Parelaphostrongylus tenuis TaxID=148309 RepID=A0AAD5MH24_PARTN|nr:hypothetical protein KIN20_014372 [Parelaphostrongylus tenuis]
MEVEPSIFVCPEAGNPVKKNLNDAVIVGEVRPMTQTETKSDGGVGGVQGLDCKADAARSGGSEDQFPKLQGLREQHIVQLSKSRFHLDVFAVSYSLP